MGNSTDDAEERPLKRPKMPPLGLPEAVVLVQCYIEDFDDYNKKFLDSNENAAGLRKYDFHEKWARTLSALGYSERTAKQIGKRIEGDVAMIKKRIMAEKRERAINGGQLLTKMPPLDVARQKLYDFLVTCPDEARSSLEGGMDSPSTSILATHIKMNLSDIEQREGKSEEIGDPPAFHHLPIEESTSRQYECPSNSTRSESIHSVANPRLTGPASSTALQDLSIELLREHLQRAKHSNELIAVQLQTAYLERDMAVAKAKAMGLEISASLDGSARIEELERLKRANS